MSEKTTAQFAWKLVLSLVPLGLLFAALTITGSLHGVGPTKWVALGLLAVIGSSVALWAPGRPFLHGLAAGSLASLVAIEGQALFLETYFANNPGYAGLEMPFGLTARQATALLGPVNALLAGLVAGLLAWLIHRVSKKVAGARGIARG